MGKDRFRKAVERKSHGLGDCSEGLPKDQNPQHVSPKLNKARKTSPTRTKRRR